MDGTDEEFDSNTLLLALRRDRLGVTTTFAYDAYKRLRQIVDPAGLATNIDWTGTPGATAVGLITTPDGRTSRLGTDWEGQLIDFTDPDGARALLVTHLSNRIVTATIRIGGTTTYAYDAMRSGACCRSPMGASTGRPIPTSPAPSRISPA